MKYLESLKIQDSKEMKDSYIKEIGPKLVKRIKNYVVSISAKKLSYLESLNMNKNNILSKSHNLAHLGIIRKYNINTNVIIYVDQFVDSINYKKYVDVDLVKNPIYFRTKGEIYFPSVAISSVSARYYLLKEFDKMKEVFGVEVLKGASSDVDKMYLSLVKKFGNSKVDEYVKKYFSNYTRLNS